MKDDLTPFELSGTARLPLFDRFLVVYRHSFSVSFYMRPLAGHALRPHHTWPCAIGAAGHETPPGPKFVIVKTDHPDWQVPNSPWAIAAGLTPGETIPFGSPDNPIKGAFLKLTDDGVGIHGTGSLDSLGHQASHGCIRVRPEVAKWLYENVPVGTPVMVV